MHNAAQAAYEIVRKHDIINLIFEAWDYAMLPAYIEGRMSAAQALSQAVDHHVDNARLGWPAEANDRERERE